MEQPNSKARLLSSTRGSYSREPDGPLFSKSIDVSLRMTTHRVFLHFDGGYSDEEGGAPSPCFEWKALHVAECWPPSSARRGTGMPLASSSRVWVRRVLLWHCCTWDGVLYPFSSIIFATRRVSPYLLYLLPPIKKTVQQQIYNIILIGKFFPIFSTFSPRSFSIFLVFPIFFPKKCVNLTNLIFFASSRELISRIVTDHLRILIRNSNYFQTLGSMEKTLSGKDDESYLRTGVASTPHPP